MKNLLKRRILPGILCLTVLCLSLSSCGAPKEAASSSSMQNEQRSFDEYTNGLFQKEMQNNTINLRYTLSNPADFGIKSHKISLGSLSKESEKASMASMENILASLSEFDYGELTTKQQLTYDILKQHCETERGASSLYYYKEPLRPTTGMQSELPVLLAEYEFHTPCDVTDYLSLLTCVEEYFHQICVFEQEKAKEGLFMPSFAAETVIASCNAFTENPDQNFLIDTFQERIEKVSELSDEKKELYIKQNRSLVENAVIPAYEMLSRTLTELKDTGINDGGLCHLPQGKDYYEYLVKNNTGSEKKIKDLQKLVERQRNLDMAGLHELLTDHPALISSGEPELSVKDPKEMLDHLTEAMQEHFFPAANTSYEVNYIHPSLEDTLAPAFYLTAPIDDISHNVIYLNKSSQYSGIQLFTTLAHEGFPGHLYQTTGTYQAGLAPIRALLNHPGYVEGWATYVEMLSYQYAGIQEDLAELLMRNQSALLSLYASIDLGVHYDGWKIHEIYNFLKKYGFTDKKMIQRIYELVTEEPSHYLKYYVGYLEFLELKEYAKKIFGETYSDRAFHQAVLRIGPAPFAIVKEYWPDFYTPES